MTTRYIRITGDLVEDIEEHVLRTATLAEMVPHLVQRPKAMFWHPRSAILTDWDEASSQRYTEVRFLSELPPAIRNITKVHGGVAKRYRLAMPWTYFIFSFRTSERPIRQDSGFWEMRDHKVFHSPERIRDGTSRLWAAFLPNVYEDGRICFGSTGTPPGITVADRIDQYVNEWYLTEFNNDVHGSRYHPLPFNGNLPLGWRLWVDATNSNGIDAYRMFPEWNALPDDARVSNFTIQQLFNMREDNRPLTITTDNAIPAIVEEPTFGRAEEWVVERLEPVQRVRLAAAFDAQRAENPTLFEVPEDATPIDPGIDLQGDDGGVVITTP